MFTSSDTIVRLQLRRTAELPSTLMLPPVTLPSIYSIGNSLTSKEAMRPYSSRSFCSNKAAKNSSSKSAKAFLSLSQVYKAILYHS